MTDDELRAELLKRMEADQDIREPAGEPPSPERMAQWRSIDRDNTAWLLSVIGARGWPLLSQVGEDGALAAWLLAQHADASPEVQREFHRALSDAVSRNEAKPAHLAYLEEIEFVWVPAVPSSTERNSSATAAVSGHIQ